MFSHPEKFTNFKTRIELFENLRKLCLFNTEMSEFLQDLPLLKKLTVLMIPNYYHFQESGHRIEFKSSSLKKLSFKYTTYERQTIDSIDFNTPNLTYLSLIFWGARGFPVDSVKFSFPLKIKHLECIEFRSDMNELNSLESLNCQQIVCPFKLDDFKSLQKLELFPKKDDELDYINELIRQKERLGRKSLEILVCGFKDIVISFRAGSHSFITVNDHFLDHVTKNPASFVGRIPWSLNLDSKHFVDELFEERLKELPKNFLNKFAKFTLLT